MCQRTERACTFRAKPPSLAHYRPGTQASFASRRLLSRAASDFDDEVGAAAAASAHAGPDHNALSTEMVRQVTPLDFQGVPGIRAAVGSGRFFFLLLLFNPHAQRDVQNSLTSASLCAPHAHPERQKALTSGSLLL